MQALVGIASTTKLTGLVLQNNCPPCKVVNTTPLTMLGQLQGTSYMKFPCTAAPALKQLVQLMLRVPGTRKHVQL